MKQITKTPSTVVVNALRALFFIIRVMATSDTTCSGSGTRFVDGTCYRYFTGPLTWFDAKRHCEVQGTVLASVKSLDQIKRILIQQDIKEAVWIGATDLAIERQYVWIHNNHPANDDLAKLWDSRRPNNYIKYVRGDQDCISVHKNYHLHDTPCSSRNSYICMEFKTLPGMYSQLKLCPDGKFGYRCQFSCQCPNNETCDKVTGLCNDGKCKDGYWGPGCQLDDQCYYNKNLRLYLGKLNLTEKRIPCQDWNRKYPHRHKYTERDFIDRRLPNNYCRGTIDSSQPWCYTTFLTSRWKKCSLKSCDCPQGRYDIYCSKECHCKASDEQCNNVTGECTTGCAKGWSGKDCQTVVPCETNYYGWECERKCQCENPSHCHRFVGPTPPCGPGNSPVIFFLGNNKVSPGQISTFTCTVQGTPPPSDNEIHLFGPLGKNITPISSKLSEVSGSTRTKMFYVDNVKKSEQYTCWVNASAGTDMLTVIAEVFSLPECPNEILISNINNNQVRISWKPMEYTTNNQKFQVMMHNLNTNLTNNKSKGGIVIGEIINATEETLTYNIDSLTNMSEHAFTLVTSNEYGKVECTNTRTAYVTSDVKIIILSSQYIVLITICPTLLLVIMVGFIIYRKRGKKIKTEERPHTYDALIRNRNGVVSVDISTNEYSAVQGISTPAYIKLNDSNIENHYDYVDHDYRSTNNISLHETDGC